MSRYNYERYDTRSSRPAARHRSVFGFWVPVVMTTAIAAGGLAAWVMRARDHHDHSSEDDEDLSYGGETDHSHGPGPGPSRPADPRRPGSEAVSEGVTGGGAAARDENTRASVATGSQQQQQQQDSTILGRVAATMRRTPSPQQLLDGASKRVAAGVAAAGAAVGGALSAIHEDHEDDYADHERWREEDAARRAGDATRGARGAAAGNRRTVAIVVSASEEGPALEEEKGWKSEQAVSVVACVGRGLLADAAESLCFRTSHRLICPLSISLSSYTLLDFSSKTLPRPAAAASHLVPLLRLTVLSTLLGMS